GRLWCPACKRRRFVLRAVTMPVSGPSGATWAELRTALHASFAETTGCANWLMSELYARDRQRRPEDERPPKMPPIYVYPEARVRFPALASQTLASLERQAQARYRAVRLDLVWRHAVSLPTYRYPTPLPLPSRMWQLVLLDQRWHLSARIGDRRWSLRLRQGPGMWRQIRLLQEVAAGALEAGEATLYEIPSHRGDHRSDGTRERRLMVKLVVWLPAPEAAGARETLIVRTAPDAFLTAHLVGQGHVWRLNADHIRRWIAETARRQQRLDVDRAHDCQHRGSRCSTLVDEERRLSAQLRRRLHAWTHQATAQLVGWAQRQRVATIAWDDTDRGFLPSYPWHQLVTTLADKAGAVGITVVVHGSGDRMASASHDVRTGEEWG
ncbi:MAG: hypothetical protein ACRD2X_09365, partial [Vicinamibacteraceae bacterium]